MESKSVFTINEYGRINIRLRELMDSRHITRNYLAKASNTRFEVINKWYQNQVEKMDLELHAGGHYRIRTSLTHRGFTLRRVFHSKIFCSQRRLSRCYAI